MKRKLKWLASLAVITLSPSLIGTAEAASDKRSGTESVSPATTVKDEVPIGHIPSCNCAACLKTSRAADSASAHPDTAGLRQIQLKAFIEKQSRNLK